MKNLRTLCWKELRENFKWALLAGVIISEAMFYTLSFDANRAYEDTQTLCGKSFMTLPEFGFPIIGLLLGFLQILTEQRRDQWAFLLHRPISRNELFWGKVLPGSLLYLGATIIPLMMTACWLAVPGNYPAPFGWEMVLPSTLEILNGLAAYFAALLTSLWSGRWRKAAALLAVYSVSVFGMSFGSTLDVWVNMTLVTAALLLAAWATLTSGSVFRRMNGWGKLGIIIAVLFAGSVIQHWILRGCHLAFPMKFYSIREEVTKDGRFLSLLSNRYGISKIHTFDGKQLSEQESAAVKKDDFLRRTQLDMRLHDRRPYGDFWNRNYRSTFYHFYLGDDAMYKVYWYYSQKDLGYLAYDKRSKKLVEGLIPNEPELLVPVRNSRQLQANYDNAMSYLTFKNGVKLVDLQNSTVSEFVEIPADEIMLDIGNRRYTRDDPVLLLVVTDKFLRAFDQDGKINFVFAQPENWEQYSFVQMYQKPDGTGYYLHYTPRFTNDSDYRGPQAELFLNVSQDGTVLEKLSKSESWKEYSEIDGAMVRWSILFPVGQKAWTLLLEYLGYPGTAGVKFSSSYYLSAIPWLISLAVGLLCAAVGSLFVKRLRGSRTARVGWLVFLVFYGIGGLLAFWLVNDWALRLTCPKCGKKRSAGDAECEHCAATWPLPLRDGTEIFNRE